MITYSKKYIVLVCFFITFSYGMENITVVWEKQEDGIGGIETEYRKTRISPDEQYIACAYNNRLKLFAANNGSLINDQTFSSKITCLEFASPKTLAVGIKNAHLFFYNIVENQVQFDGAYTLEKQIDGIIFPEKKSNPFAIISEKQGADNENKEKERSDTKTIITLVKKNTALTEKIKVESPYSKSCFSPNGKVLFYTNGRDGEGNIIVNSIEKNNSTRKKLKICLPLTDIAYLIHSPSDKKLLALSTIDKKLVVYDLKTKKIQEIPYKSYNSIEQQHQRHEETYKKASPGSIVFSPDGTKFAVVAYNICALYSWPDIELIYFNEKFTKQPNFMRIFFVDSDRFIVNDNSDGSQKLQLIRYDDLKKDHGTDSQDDTIAYLRIDNIISPLYFLPNALQVIQRQNNYMACIGIKRLSNQKQSTQTLFNKTFNRAAIYGLSLLAGGYGGYLLSKKFGFASSDLNKHYGIIIATTMACCLLSNFFLKTYTKNILE